MKQFKLILSGVLIAGLVTLGLYSCKKLAQAPSSTKVTLGSHASDNGKVALDTLIFSGSPASDTSISVTLTAGASGAPAGFSLQWMPQAAFIAGGSVWPSDTTLFCEASFSGNANSSRYALAAGAPVTVIVGAFVHDNGFSTDCAGPLLSCTKYVFRSFAHGNSNFGRSAFSGANVASTACPVGACIIGGPGYWKNYLGNAPASWPETGGFNMGSMHYTNAQLEAILNQPDGGNGLVSVAKQYIASKLNQVTGATGYSFTAADAYINLHTATGGGIPPMGTSSAAASTAHTITSTLNGGVCPN